MKINSISSNYYFQTQSRNTKSNENEKVVNQSDLKTVDSSKLALAFKANLAAGHRRVVLENKETKMAYDKMVQILKKLPDSAKMTKPILIKVGEENLGFTWDKSSRDKYKLIIKNNINNSDDWTKADATRSVMSCMFDNNGMMQVGELTKPLKPDYSQGVFFHHTGKVGRRIRLNDVTLKPTSSSHDVWQVVPELSTKNASGDIDLSVRLKNVMLSDLFLELAKNRTSIFL